MKKKVILFGIDGATWNILDKYISDGSLPTFEYLIHNGVKGTLVSTFPMVTLPSWTSIFTGVNPGKHGITDFILQLDGRFVLANSKYRKAESLWQILSRHDHASIVVNDPSAFPPEKIKGVMTTGLITPPNSNYVYPPQLKNEIERIADGYMSDLPVEYYQIISKDKGKAYNMIEQSAAKISKVTQHLAQNYEWTVLAPIFTSTDKLQHFYWFDESYIRKHYMFIDRCLKDFLDIASAEEAQICIVSDHGFGPLNKALYINTWLSKIGLQKIKRNDMLSFMTKLGLTRSQLIWLLRRMKLYNTAYNFAKRFTNFTEMALFFDKPIDFENSLAYSEAEGIYINKKLAKERYHEVREQIITELHKIIDDGLPIVEKVFRREEVVWGPYTDRASDLFVILREGYIFRYWSDAESKNDGQEIKEAKGLKGETAETGGHRPEGIFAAYGPGIRKNVTLNRFIHTWDVVPTILHLLELPIPSYIDGRVLSELFSNDGEFAERSIKQELVSEREKIRERLKNITEAGYHPK
ncbi:MAG: alkaline phosphatase family protein [Nitrososphaerales archaeon]